MFRIHQGAMLSFRGATIATRATHGTYLAVRWNNPIMTAMTACPHYLEQFFNQFPRHAQYFRPIFYNMQNTPEN